MRHLCLSLTEWGKARDLLCSSILLFSFFCSSVLFLYSIPLFDSSVRFLCLSSAISRCTSTHLVMLSTRSLRPLSRHLSTSSCHTAPPLRFFSSVSSRQACPSRSTSCPGKNNASSSASRHSKQDASSSAEAHSLLRASFWSSRSTWNRAAINTLRCLVGCTIGDFSALWVLQTYLPGLGMGTIMGISSISALLPFSRFHALSTQSWHDVHVSN